MGQRVVHYFTDDGRLVDVQVEEWDEEIAQAPTRAMTRDELTDRAFLRWLLDRCDLQGVTWPLERVDPGRLLLVCCAGLWMDKKARLRTPSPRRWILAVLARGSDVDDHRSEILADLGVRLQADRERTGPSQAFAKMAADAERADAWEALQRYRQRLATEGATMDDYRKRRES